MDPLRYSPLEATCYPSEDSRTLSALVDEGCRDREALFTGVALRLKDSESNVWVDTGLDETVEEFVQATPEERRQIAGHPVFALSLDELLRAGVDLADAELSREVTKLVSAYKRTRTALHAPDVLRVDDTELRRWDTDPVIAELAPPTYTFPPAAECRRRIDADAYRLTDFAKFAAAALNRIGTVWPELRRQFGLVVRVIVQIPDASYRSASAVRYRGVVFLSSDDATVLELEESLVHEFGHQVLYELMAAHPLLADSSEESYRLPWSGSYRDFYGYVHAFYIYLLLALYLERALHHSVHDPQEVQPLFHHIVSGLEDARADFGVDARFTETGARFIEALQKELDGLEARLTKERELTL